MNILLNISLLNIKQILKMQEWSICKDFLIKRYGLPLFSNPRKAKTWSYLIGMILFSQRLTFIQLMKVNTQI